MQRGELWWAVFPPPVGSEPAARRPVVVVQADSFNQSRIGTVLVVAVTSNLALAAAQTSVQAMEQHVQDLRRQAERVIKAPGAQLKSAPFRSASSLKSLETGTQVVIVIATPYWYGVETEEGQHGWIHREQLEPLP